MQQCRAFFPASKQRSAESFSCPRPPTLNTNSRTNMGEPSTITQSLLSITDKMEDSDLNQDISRHRLNGQATDIADIGYGQHTNSGAHTMGTTDTAMYMDEPMDGETDLLNSNHGHDVRRGYPLRYLSGELKRTFPSTWIDHDVSGDYDPNEEARNLRVRKKRPRPLHREQLDWYDDIPERVDSPIGVPQIVLPMPPIRLTFADPNSRARFSEICASAEVKRPSACDSLTGGYRLRKQKQNAQEQLIESSDGQSCAPSLSDNLTGHPCARGCKPCLRMGIECSLLLDEHFWPCEGCRGEEGETCELIVPPVRKLACLRCQRLRNKHTWLRCSFLYDGEHQGPCEHCLRDGQQDCIAEPDPSSIPVRIRIGFDGRLYKHEARRLQKTTRDNTCRQCQEAKRMCSFSNGGTGDTCTACDMTGVPCKPLIAVRAKHQHATQPRSARQKKVSDFLPSEERPRSVEKPSSRGKAIGDSLGASDASDADQEFEGGGPPSYTMSGALPMTPKQIETQAAGISQSSRGKVKRVQTKFSHPMRFNWEPSSTNELQCHFCSSVGFPILGLEERKVEVIDWESGEGFEEISGGHAGDGVESTRVCLECTTARLEVIMCDRHQFRPIIGLNAAALDLQAALIRLLDGDAVVGREKWCAICCNLATYECVTGCRLQLCGQCATELTYEYHWDLQEMLLRISARVSDERPLGLRADCELLKSDGLLVRYVQFASEQ